jgi:ABC-type oligopeptide transport system substrate-binding subunit
MSAYRRGLTSHVAGIETRGDALRIRFRRRVAHLDELLSATWSCAVPKGTPAAPSGLQGPIPSAGPYYAAGLGGGAYIVLRRNPHFPDPSATGFDAFVYTFNVDARRALDMVRRGRADYAAFYGRRPSRRLVARAVGLTATQSPRRAAAGGDVTEVFGRRLGCRSYGPVYAGVVLKRLCVRR